MIYDISPMLAKKFEDDIKYDKDGYYITEKLDGNRCIASYSDGKWNFTSRNGKAMYVDFDMEGLDKNFVYDGEILSPEQVEMSNAIHAKVVYDINLNKKFSDMFSGTSGLINRHTTDKKLVYNIFDIQDSSATYRERREVLDSFTNVTSLDVRILPVLKHCKDATELQECYDILDKIVAIGGEGAMINLGSANYMHKRTDRLLKLKKVYTMDMVVYDVEYGTGKYEGQIGALKAIAKTPDNKVVRCNVGSGLTDEQRLNWSKNLDLIINKIIEVSYFSLSQTKEDREYGTNMYSLRFPRLKCVRTDKDVTSID